MKTPFVTLCLAVTLLSLSAGPLLAQGGGARSAAVANLSADQKVKLAKHMRDASDYIARDRLADAFQELDEAGKIVPDLYSIWNLRGAAWVRLKDVPKARAAFTKAAQLSPGSWDVRFNLAELKFVEHKFADARAEFASILQDHPRIPTTQYDLISFKIFVCLIREGNEDLASKIEERFSYLDETPAFYYAKATRGYQKEDKETAASWLQSASRIFSAQQNQVYLDSLIELGWVQSIEQPTSRPGRTELKETLPSKPIVVPPPPGN